MNHKQRATTGERTQRVTQSPPRVHDAPPTVPDAPPRVPPIWQWSTWDPTETPPQPEGSPASRTRSKTAHLRVASAAAVRHIKQSKRHRLTKRIERMENEVHQAMAVMDAETGKVLNYRQLMQSTKHKETWSKSSKKTNSDDLQMG